MTASETGLRTCYCGADLAADAARCAACGRDRPAPRRGRGRRRRLVLGAAVLLVGGLALGYALVRHAAAKGRSELLARGNTALEDGRTADAVAAARAILRDRPDDVRARRLLALGLTAQGDADEARSLAEGLLASDAGDAVAHEILARRAALSGDVTAALEHAQAAGVRARDVEAWALSRLGRLDEAVAAYDRALERRDAPLGLRVAAARCRLQADPAGAAVPRAFWEVLQRAATERLAEEPDDATAAHGLALALTFASPPLGEPRPALERALALRPDPELALALATAQLRDGDAAGAARVLRDCAASRETPPSCAPALVARAAAAGGAPLAAEIAASMRRTAPQDPDVLLAAGDAAFLARDLDAAEEDWSKAAAAREDRFSLSRLARLEFARRGALGTAAARLRAAAPDAPELLVLDAQAALAAGDFAAADASARRAAADPASSAEARVVLLLVAARRHDAAALERLAGELLAAPDLDAATVRSLARELLLEGLLGEARRFAQRALAARPDDADAAWLLARTLVADGAPLEAARVLAPWVARPAATAALRHAYVAALVAADEARAARRSVESWALPDRAERAVLLALCGDVAEARRALADAPGGDDGDASAPLARARVELLAGNAEGAEAILRERLAGDPTDGEARAFLADLLFDRGGDPSRLDALLPPDTETGGAAEYLRALGALAHGDATVALASLEALHRRPGAPPRVARRLAQALGDSAPGRRVLLLREVLAAEPGSERARVELAAALRDALRSDAESVAGLDEIERLGEALPVLPAARALADLRRLGSDEAVETSRSLLERSPGDWRTRTVLALALARRGDWAAALTESERALADQAAAGVAATPALRGARAAALIGVGRAAEAVRELDALLAATQRHPLLLLWRLRAALALDDGPGAASLAEELTRARPEQAAAWLAAGAAYTRAQRPADAESALRRARSLRGEWLAPRLALARLLLTQKRTAEAAEVLPAEGSAEGECATLWAELRIAQGELDAALALLRRALPQDPRAGLLLGALLEKRGDPAGAVAAYDVALDAGLGGARFWAQAGILLHAAGRLADARRHFEEALRLDPDYLPAVNDLALVLADSRDDLARAQELARRAVELAPENAAVADTLGWVLLRRDNHAAAERELRRALELSKGASPDAHYHLGLTLEVRGDRSAARASLERALELAPDAPWAADARAALGRMR